MQAIPRRDRDDVFNYFEYYLDRALEAIGEWQNILNYPFDKAQELPVTSALELPETLTCDGVITSPPYINAIDYVWASKLELHWLGLVKSDRDRLELYEREIGTERIPKKEYQELGQTGYPELDQLIVAIYRGG